MVAGPYDAVVVAAPLEHSAISFHGVGARALPAREFRKVSTTFVAGHLRASCWNVTVLPTGAPPHALYRTAWPRSLLEATSHVKVSCFASSTGNTLCHPNQIVTFTSRKSSNERSPGTREAECCDFETVGLDVMPACISGPSHA